MIAKFSLGLISGYRMMKIMVNDEMTNLSILDEDTILKELKSRYLANKIYVGTLLANNHEKIHKARTRTQARVTRQSRVTVFDVDFIDSNIQIEIRLRLILATY